MGFDISILNLNLVEKGRKKIRIENCSFGYLGGKVSIEFKINAKVQIGKEKLIIMLRDCVGASVKHLLVDIVQKLEEEESKNMER